MKIMRYIYKTKTLANNGKFLLVMLFVVAAAGVIYIPKFKYNSSYRQILHIPGTYLKYDDHNEVDAFITSIRNNKGYLCLGTSESGDLDAGNYYSFLNNDSSLSMSFSVLAGAGRNCGLYAPIFLNHKKAVKNLQVIYFINPVYWNETLAELDKEYWDRYSSYGMFNNIDWNNATNRKYKADVDIYSNKLNALQKASQRLEYEIRNYRKYFFMDLKMWINPTHFENELIFTPSKKDLTQFKNFGKIDTEKIDTVWNKEYNFNRLEWFKPINEVSNYRYEELKSFIRLCKDLGIKSTYVIGPYNEHFIRQKQPGALPAYKKVTEKTKALLQAENVDYIDAVDISPKAGAFIDHQHHSSYGAYLLYLKIKTHILEKETH